MNPWQVIKSFEYKDYKIIISTAPEEVHPEEVFDPKFHDIEDICRRIDLGYLDWFQLRVHAQLCGHTLGEAYCGGFLYEDANQIFTDGILDDLVNEAINDADTNGRQLLAALQKMYG